MKNLIKLTMLLSHQQEQTETKKHLTMVCLNVYVNLRQPAFGIYLYIYLCFTCTKKSVFSFVFFVIFFLSLPHFHQFDYWTMTSFLMLKWKQELTKWKLSFAENGKGNRHGKWQFANKNIFFWHNWISSFFAFRSCYLSLRRLNFTRKFTHFYCIA